MADLSPAERIIAANPGEWLSTGRTYDEQRFSPLTQINDKNADTLGIAWSADLDTQRGQEATPLMIDGRLIVSTAWSMVKAFDAKTGKLLWSYDPKVPRETLVKACCDAVNRGVAAWGGNVFVGTLDGRLIALDAATGKMRWSVVTVDQSKDYTITGAPRVIKGKVLIGNGGAEYGVRGYVTAYDFATGKKLWRFYTVPGDPKKPFEGDYLKKAAATWHGDFWKMGGGGTVWDSIVYDAELDQLLVGVGNGSPWNHRARSDGKGDNLFLSSIVALDPDTGKYRWHYQETPAESWDFTATQQITLATLTIDGRPRKVLMQAPKNGFFYVLDRTNGKPISANNYVPVNWATGIDPKTWRPIEVAGARYADKPFTIYPSGIGAHAWMPMSYSPKTGLVYIPAMEVPITLGDDVNFERHYGRWNTGTTFGGPPAANATANAPRREGKGELVAWDPIKQKEAWHFDYEWPWNGGTLATAGNLVFQGDAHGLFRAFTADKGKPIWQFQAQRGIMAGPITYRIKGEQYVVVMAGYGGSMGMASATPFMRNPPPPGMILAFKLGGKAKLPVTPQPPLQPYAQVAESFTAAQVADGGKWFGTYCNICHGGPVNPDLRRSALLADKDAWNAVVIGGALEPNGMDSFAKYLTPAQAENIRAYLAGEAKRLAKAK